MFPDLLLVFVHFLICLFLHINFRTDMSDSTNFVKFLLISSYIYTLTMWHLPSLCYYVILCKHGMRPSVGSRHPVWMLRTGKKFLHIDVIKKNVYFGVFQLFVCCHFKLMCSCYYVFCQLFYGKYWFLHTNLIYWKFTEFCLW